MGIVPCPERDRIILAFALAVNQQNHVSATLDALVDEGERDRMMNSIEASRGHCRELRDLLVLHCQKHGC